MPGAAHRHRWLRERWLRRGVWACLLWPLSVPLAALVLARRWAYRRGWFASTRVRVPVIVIGNVIVGGAGKTPLAIWLVERLRQGGRHPGLISRGYGRHSHGCLEVRTESDAEQVGDEPLLVKRRLNVPVMVAERRAEAAQALLAAHPDVDVLICDDGLQHLALARDLELCVFDERGLGNAWMLPAGPLREPWPRPVDLIVETGGRSIPGSLSASRRLHDHAIDGFGQRLPLQQFAGRRILAMAGTARPEAFFDMLATAGVRVAATQAWPDHHDFRDWSIPPGFDHVLCTEKDAVKLWPRHPRVLAVPLVFDPSPELTDAIDRAIAGLPRPPL